MKAVLVDNISFSYNDKIIYKDYETSFNKGEVSIIMSPSGSGKTTLLYLIAGLLKSDKGNITYYKENPKFSFVFQDDRLIENLSIIKNLKLVNDDLSEEEIMECLKELGLMENLTKKVGKLSGGERQRISIARALLADYDILLLDEPFTGLDDEVKAKVIKYIKNKTAGKTVIVVTHDKREAELMM